MLLTLDPARRDLREAAIKIAEFYPAGLKAGQLRDG